MVELSSRRVLHFGVTRHPSDAWVAQQLREATPYATVPRLLIRDNDRKYGSQSAQVAKFSQIQVLCTPYRAPCKAVCERFLGSVRRECLDHMFILSERQWYRVLQEHVTFFNAARPPQGLQQQIPVNLRASMEEKREGKIVVIPVLSGLHHDYRRAA